MSGIIGFQNIIDELAKITPLTPATATRTKINQYDPREEIGGWKVPDLELVVEGNEFLDVMTFSLDQASLLSGQQKQKGKAKHLSIASNNSYDDEDEEKNISASEHNVEQHNQTSYPDLGISDSSLKGYKVIFNTGDNIERVRIGDIIGIKNNSAIEVGIIHRIIQLTEHKLQLGIKLLALESDLVYISPLNKESVYAWALFLPGIKELDLMDSIIFNDSKFQCGEFVNLHRTDQDPASYRLNNIIHLSSAATHIELFQSSVMND